ncbi:hypothetical protein P7K49_027310 [Saguinus oedipus]|uniref:Uncharacterized protein n=1 Tax=Saguinus oedipus TaxID=9490 RepID=A0ABQ9U929_SAGOE|nr:hypothetical protein P7K49_027310 [Saguinus oedipus]
MADEHCLQGTLIEDTVSGNSKKEEHNLVAESALGQRPGHSEISVAQSQTTHMERCFSSTHTGSGSSRTGTQYQQHPSTSTAQWSHSQQLL